MSTREQAHDQAVDWAPDHPDLLADVYGRLDEQLRRCPVPAAESPRGDHYYSALRFDDVVKVVTDKSSFSSGANVLREDLRRIPVELDPPEHTVMRRLLQPYFVPKRMESLRPRIAGFARELVDDLLRGVEPGGRGVVEYVDGFASPYPTRVLCATLNLPDEDWGRLKEWSLAVSSQGDGDGRGPDFATANEALKEYARAIIAERRVRPLPVEEDMASGLLAARPHGEPLSEEQMVGVLRLMFSAGHLTTTIALGIITRHLAEHPEHQDRLRADPAFVDHAIEEILRHSSPVVANANPRTVVQPVSLGGRELQPGDRVLPVWGAANRDESRFERPTEVDLDRPAGRTMVYGHGIHLCLGAPVARFELAEATRVLLGATTRFEVAGQVDEGDWWRQRGPTRLPLEVARA
ncbi:cytochrome P450 [Nocardioides sp. zg-579]|uniref:Cytochrome P450 n=1 Tax=Nocardioides marmotae TaxID=2663857 RepID=A0A6I3ITR6_9ACTN|nr:cytochrome P450 [Nocardioides marmotae]MCR6030241.1 cytochrome P450 [Gordonia jinghuaiqii]MTB93873.1 cytochrome P450 [Nocardioides marmotae]QKE00196.1 cytochrome P450 [Nocardioides marmotae]